MKEFLKRNINIFNLILLIGFVFSICLYLKDILKILSQLISILHPVILGLFIAFVLNLIVSPLEKLYFPNSNKKIVLKTRRLVCILAAFILISLLFIFLILLVVPELYKSILTFSEQLPGIIVDVKNFVITHSDKIPNFNEKLITSHINMQKIFDTVNSLISYLTNNVLSFLGGVFSFSASFIMSTILAIYIVASKEMLKRQTIKLMNRYLKEKHREKLLYVSRTLSSSLGAYLTGQTLEAIILGALCTVGLLIFRFPYAPMIGSVVGFTALIPMLGAYIGGTFGFIMMLTYGPVKALLFLLFLLILQQFEGNVIYPKVVGGSVGLPGVWVMIAIMVGGGLYGIVGIFLSVPLGATIFKIIKNDVNKLKINNNEAE